MPGQAFWRSTHRARHLSRADARQQARNHAIARDFTFPHLANERVNLSNVRRHERLGYLKQSRRALTAADAHSADDIFRASTFSFDERMANHARAGHAVRVADRNGAAIDVQFLIRNAELIAAVKNLDRESFVELPEIRCRPF